MKDGLKPCPFCGGEVEMHYTGSSDWEVSCRTCPVETKFWVSAQKHGYGEGERLEAMRRWNQRSSEAQRKPDPTCLNCGRQFQRNHGKNRFCSPRCSARFGRPSLQDRFMSFVRKTDGCWEWAGARTQAGYGVFNIANKARIAHRIAYRLFKGSIPSGMFVCHSCDNPPCVNPEHLWLGDAKANAEDMVKKGRYKPRVLPCGEQHHKAKISAEDAAYIKSSKEHRSILCKRFGVSVGTISNIRMGKTWGSTLGKSPRP